MLPHWLANAIIPNRRERRELNQRGVSRMTELISIVYGLPVRATSKMFHHLCLGGEVDMGALPAGV